MAKLSTLTDFVDRLDTAQLHYTMTSVTEGAIKVGVTVPGEHWEIEFNEDGDIEVEIYRSNGELHDLEKTEELIATHGEE